MNGCQASLAVIACASSDIFGGNGAYAGMEFTIARYGWRWYVEEFVAPMVSRWQPRGVVWDFPGAKAQKAKFGKPDEMEIVFPLSRFGFLEKTNPRLSFEEFLEAAAWLADACDVKEQILYTGGPDSGAPGDVYPALCDALGEVEASNLMVDSFFALVQEARFTGVVFDAVADAGESGRVARLLKTVVRRCPKLQVIVEGPPYRKPECEIWMQREKVGAWQTTQAFRAQAAQAINLQHQGRGERPGDLFLSEVKGPTFMGFNGTCPLGGHAEKATPAGWWTAWIKICVERKITPCWSFLGNDELCKLAERALVVDAATPAVAAEGTVNP